VRVTVELVLGRIGRHGCVWSAGCVLFSRCCCCRRSGDLRYWTMFDLSFEMMDVRLKDLKVNMQC